MEAQRIGRAPEDGGQSGTPAGPNVLVIHTDQHRIDCLGAYGNREIHTPHLDSLAADGVRYTHSFCPYPVCTPSRYSLLSGQYVHQHRGSTNHSTMRPGTPTFPALLAEAGYRTAAVGKMHFTPTYAQVGFQRMMLAEQHGVGRWDDDYHRWLRQRDLVDCNDLEDQEQEFRRHARPVYWETYGALPSNLPEEAHSTTWIGDRALEVLADWTATGGNLLMVGFVKPHHPFDPPARWAAMYDPQAITPLPGWTDAIPAVDPPRTYFDYAPLTPATLRRVTAYYYATISHVDAQVGRMIDYLRKRGLYDDTLIVFTADHGEYLGFHHLLLKGNHLYDPLAKVPLIVKHPTPRSAANAPADSATRSGGGTVSDGLVSTVDVAPTILRTAGLPIPAEMAGLALNAPHAPREVICAEATDGQRGELLARDKRFKLLYQRGDPPGAAHMLFDLAADPHELANRYGDPALAEAQQRLERALGRWFPGEGYDPYLDEGAPTIAAPNVPPPGIAHREQILAYYLERMRHQAR